jgi:hypothetical protein
VGGLATLGMACGGSDGDGTNRPPDLTLDVGSSETYVVGEDIIQIRPSATDPEGDPLEFEVANKPERAEFIIYDRRAYFRWDPIASDVTMEEPRRLTFIVRDNQGNRTDKVVRLTIKPGNGQPSFRRTPGSVSYNINSDNPVEFEVEVRDDNSNELDLSMPAAEAPEGAEFTTSGPKTGQFSWEPTPIQKETRVHSVTFVADDGDNPPVEHTVKILFKNQRPEVGPGDPQNYQQNCEAELPIDHDAVGAQHTLEDYRVTGSFSESAADKFDVAGILWTTEDAFNKGADISFNAEEMSIDGRNMSGTIPNLQLASGESESVHYQICAIDNDAPSDAPDAYVCSPSGSGLYHSFVAYSPDDTACVDDSKQIGGWEDPADISADKWRHFRLCSGSSDLHRFTVESGTVGYAFFTFPVGQPIDFQVFDADQNPIDGDALQVSSCAGLARVAFEREASQEDATYYVQVTGNDIPYQTRYTARTPNQQQQCEADAEEPNDARDEATLLLEEKTLSDLSICEDDTDVFLLELYEGDIFDTKLNYEPARTDLQAKLIGPGDTISRETEGLARHLPNDTGETLIHKADKTGEYHLMVYSESPPADYDLEFSTTCQDEDQFAGNHSRQNAAETDPGTYRDLKLCGDKADWYRVSATEGRLLGANVTVERGPSPEDLTVEAYDSQGNRLDGETRVVDNSKQFGFTPSSDGTRYFRVVAPSRTDYSVELAEQQ